ncbi:hypothetical protein HY357_02775 [Candidatus Roizmanbacteria bacterium]|nr:hypothetical protein [Candidatus Roizmanbacteria bacterium]
MNPTDINLLDPELQMLINNKESGYNYRERRQDDWTENYTLYRDRVVINRLTQRQSVNLPLMKLAIRTNLKDVDDMPVIYFTNRSNNKQKEVYQNEHWKETLKQNNAEIQDIVDKKQQMLFGRTFDQWQIINGKIKWTIQDPADITVDRYVDPSDLDSARWLIHSHIFIPISVLEDDPDYDKESLKSIRAFFSTDEGLIKSESNEQSYLKKQQKMQDMGLIDALDPVLGETYVELTMHFVKFKDKEDSEEQIYLFVEAEDMEIIMKKPLAEVIGSTKDDYWKTHFPYNSWADDVDRQDFWTDAVADIIRNPNKIANAWFSQLVENRTLKNLNMNIFNSNIEGFVPQTWTPQAWGMYGIPVPPGQKVEDVFHQMPVQDLSDSLDEMNFIIAMIEKATGATPTKQGVQTANKITLGEVELALNEATERVKGMSKYYTPAWHKRAEKYLKLIEAAHDKLDPMTIYKKGRNTDDIYERTIIPNDWMDDAGYGIKIWSQDEKNTKDLQSMQKWDVVKKTMPDNPKVDDIHKRKLLEFVDAEPDDINSIMEYEKQKQEALMNPMGNGVVEGQIMPNNGIGAQFSPPNQPALQPQPGGVG